MDGRLRAHAKLNVTLRVLGREESGFHSIETVMLRLQLADLLTVRGAGEGIALHVTGDDTVPTDAGNLCWQAAEMLGAGSGGPGVHIDLEKRIPAAAGLGGGSADAAAVLLEVNELLETPRSEAELYRCAGELGSDVPFGLCGSGMALAWERGRRLMPLKPPPARPVLVLVPDLPIRAAEAYEWLAEDRHAGAQQPPPPARMPGASELSDWTVLSAIAMNDLESPVFSRHPSLAALKSQLLEGGAEIAMLCGSGSCVAGVFEDEVTRDAAARRLEGLAGVEWIRTRTMGTEAPLPG